MLVEIWHSRYVCFYILERFAIASTGLRARVVYSRTFPSLTTPQTRRLNKSPGAVYAIATRHRVRLLSDTRVH